MPLINLVLVLIIVGAGLWAINQFIPMAPPFKTLINVLVIVFVVIWLLQAIGLLDTMVIGPVR